MHRKSCSSLNQIWTRYDAIQNVVLFKNVLFLYNFKYMVIYYGWNNATMVQKMVVAPQKCSWQRGHWGTKLLKDKKTNKANNCPFFVLLENRVATPLTGGGGICPSCNPLMLPLNSQDWFWGGVRLPISRPFVTKKTIGTSPP